MAIKSKGRTRSRRTVSAAPKRGLVVRKPPIWGRRWVWLVVAVAAVAGPPAGGFSGLRSPSRKVQTDRDTMTDGMFLISRSIGLYQQVGAMVQTAADLSGPDQKSIIDQAIQLTQQAGALFDQGYRKILNVTNRLNIPTTIPFNPQQ